jgi:hypothetical protein
MQDEFNFTVTFTTQDARADADDGIEMVDASSMAKAFRNMTADTELRVVKDADLVFDPKSGLHQVQVTVASDVMDGSASDMHKNITALANALVVQNGGAPNVVVRHVESDLAEEDILTALNIDDWL